MFHSRNVHYIPVPLACKKCATSNFPPRALDARSKCRARGDQHDGTSFSSLSLSLFPSFISELITRTRSQQSLLSMAAKMLENAPSSAFWVRISIRRPLEGRGSGPEQRQLSLSLSLSLSFPPSGESQCGSTLYWIMLEHECTISKTRSREVLTEQEGTPCPSSCKRSRSR